MRLHNFKRERALYLVVSMQLVDIYSLKSALHAYMWKEKKKYMLQSVVQIANAALQKLSVCDTIFSRTNWLPLNRKIRTYGAAMVIVWLTKLCQRDAPILVFFFKWWWPFRAYGRAWSGLNFANKMKLFIGLKPASSNDLISSKPCQVIDSDSATHSIWPRF